MYRKLMFLENKKNCFRLERRHPCLLNAKAFKTFDANSTLFYANAYTPRSTT